MYNRKLRNNIFISTIIIFLVSTFFHFTYELLGKNFFVGLLTPVNESVFEHLKLSLFPIILWWTSFYLFKKNKYSLDKNRWFLGATLSIIISIFIVISIYYFTVCGIGKESAIVNIASLYISLLTSQFIGFHIYTYSKGMNYLISFLIITSLIVLFACFTVNTPKLPIFEDPKSHTYGINSD